MRKLVKNQRTGEMREVRHYSPRHGGDRYNFTSKASRCSRNDEYSSFRNGGKSNQICPKCLDYTSRTALSYDFSVSVSSGHCPKCRVPLLKVSSRFRIPKNRKKRAKMFLAIK